MKNIAQNAIQSIQHSIHMHTLYVIRIQRIKAKASFNIKVPLVP